MEDEEGFSDMKDKKETFDIYRCSECGYVISAEDRANLGTMHAHCEKHTNSYEIGNVEKLEKHVQRLRVTDWEGFGSGS